jgi:hypothetical protein
MLFFYCAVAFQVNFVNAQGLGEAGIDHGGLAKELLEQIVAAGTQPEYGLFATTEDTGLLYPNPTAEAIPQGLALLEFLGRCNALQLNNSRLQQGAAAAECS